MSVEDLEKRVAALEKIIKNEGTEQVEEKNYCHPCCPHLAMCCGKFKANRKCPC